MADQWTPETQELIAEATEAHHIVFTETDAMGNNPCVCGEWWDTDQGPGWDQHMADVTLFVLAAAGLLVTPQWQEVLDAAAGVVAYWRKPVLRSIEYAREGHAVREALITAVDATRRRDSG